MRQKTTNSLRTTLTFNYAQIEPRFVHCYRSLQLDLQWQTALNTEYLMFVMFS